MRVVVVEDDVRMAGLLKRGLDHTNGGRVTDTEIGDEEGYYEVEVTVDNRRQVDVHLDQGFNVIGEEADKESPDDNDAGR